MELYMFRTVPVSLIRSFPLYTQQWCMSYMFADSLRASSGWNCEQFHFDPYFIHSAWLWCDIVIKLSKHVCAYFMSIFRTDECGQFFFCVWFVQKLPVCV